MSGMFMAKTVVIVGFNPRDIAFEKQIIDSLRPLGIDARRVFIITGTSAIEDIDDYKSWGFQIVKYEVRPNHDHSQLVELLQKILDYVPDTSLPPSAFQGELLESELPDDNTLVMSAEEEIRRALNSAVAKIVRENEDSERQQLEKIAELFDRYPRCAHKAWLVVPGHEQLGFLFGRRVERRLGEGAFGRVYLAHEGDEKRAVKVLLPEVKSNLLYLLSFRRGIESMRILNQNNTEGMVKITDAYEVPPSIFMEYVDGKTLNEAFKEGFLNRLEQRLYVIKRIGEIVSSAHALEEVVLHRDLKPANIMLRDPVFNADTFDIVVLDFDLSWHRGVHELSVAHHARVQGYAAPEQVVDGDAQPTPATRNTAVDSFGFGMVMFFLIVGRHPSPGEQDLASFRKTILHAAQEINRSGWRCVQRAITELIVSCTRRNQSDRPSVSEVTKQISQILAIITTNMIHSDDPLLVVEICEGAGMFEWDTTISDHGSQITANRQGVMLSLKLRHESGKYGLDLRLMRTKQPHDQRRTFEKYLKTKLERAAKEIRSAGFSIVEVHATKAEGWIEASIEKDSFSRRNITETCNAISSSLNILTEM